MFLQNSNRLAYLTHEKKLNLGKTSFLSTSQSYEFVVLELSLILFLNLSVFSWDKVTNEMVNYLKSLVNIEKKIYLKMYCPY